MSTTIIWFDDAGAAVSATFDADEAETHDLQNIVTEHPLENGADITDNVRPQLPRFTIQGYVTDSPTFSDPGVVNSASFVSLELQIPPYPLQISESGLIAAGVGAVVDLFSPPKTPKGTLLKLNQDASVASRKKAMFKALEDARLNARLCLVRTSFVDYNDMIIEQITVTRAPIDGNGAVFAVSLKTLEFVTSEKVDAPQPSEISGTVTNASGSKNGADDDAKRAKTNKTILARGADALGNALGI